MTIYFKNGESLSIMGEEGEKIKAMVADYLVKDGGDRIVAIKQKKEDKTVDLLLNLDEVVAMR